MKIFYNDLLDYDLWKKDVYTQDIDYIIGANIYEYDMKDAGYNLAIYYDLLDKKDIVYLGSLSKEERKVRIGLMMRDDSKLRKEITASFHKMRRKFFIDNNITENNVLSIKKDAIFIINKTCDKTKYRNVEFVVKNRYTSFHRFDNFEFYYRNKGRKLDVKGIKDEKLQFHEQYMLSFLKDIFQILETSDNSRVINKIKKFASDYKTRQLDYGFYRELNSQSMFTLRFRDKDTIIQSIEYINGFDIDHSYNYMTYILRLIQRFFFLNN